MALTNSQYEEIMRSYEKKQLQNRNILERRREEIYRTVPGYRELDGSLAGLAVAQARQLLFSDTYPGSGTDGAKNSAGIRSSGSGGPDGYRNALHGLIEKKRQLLIKYSYPPDYLEPIYDCPDCRDTGYIGQDKCHCLKKAIVDLLYAQSHLGEILKKENFEKFSFDYYSANNIDPKTGRSSLSVIQEAYRLCRNFVRDFDTSFQNLFLYGDTGIGKTFLSNCIAKELIESAHSVIYFSASRLFDELAEIRFQKGEDADSLSEYIYSCDLLIIDDLGTELVNSFVVSQLFWCLNERILRRRATIISTNLTLGALTDTYSERIFSRITSNYTMLKLTGDDIRIKKKLRNVEEEA